MMKLIFNLEYHTLPGEELVLWLETAKHTASKVAMTTLDGQMWQAVVNHNMPGNVQLDYHYAVERRGIEVRREWPAMPHHIELASHSTTSVTAWDHWRDMAGDSYLQSSAITECLDPHTIGTVPQASGGSNVLVRVCAPQLRAGQRMALVGEDAALGAWNVLRAVPMTEHARGEWVAVIDYASLASKRSIEFKFIALGGDYTGSNPMWEVGGNRTVDLPVLHEGESVAYELATAGFPIADWRIAGTVIPVFSLKSKGSFGVGDFGDLKAMVDWCASTGQRALQVLPIADTTITHTWRDSYPYNSISIYALHPMYADLRQLPKLHSKSRREHYAALQAELNELPQIDYERVNQAKSDYLHEVMEQEGAKIMASDEFKQFFAQNEQWLVPYAAFCHYRDLYGTATFSQWPDHHKLPQDERVAMATPATEQYKQVSYWYFVQFVLDTQMRGAHDYARLRHVILKGDIPIGISRDGVEAWCEPGYFNLNSQAGAPPDAFSTTGQNWGFPTYNWEAMIADGCQWWVRRFSKMSQYFDAYRIDHVLGFFRIWEIPGNAVQGLLGQFAPALGMTPAEIEGFGLGWQDYFTAPYITDWILDRTFGEQAGMVRERFVRRTWGDRYELGEQVADQKKIEALVEAGEIEKNLGDGLMSLVANVLFLADHREPGKYHPRIAAQHSLVFESLWDSDKAAFNKLYTHYFYHRNNDFWYHEAMRKLPKLVECTRMLVCAEDLGMVPDCVPWALDELRILSLEIQSMPKDPHVRFGVLAANPYRSVSTISTHDMSTLRQWWDEDWDQTQEYYNTVLWKQGPAPHPMTGDLAEQVVVNHLNSPSMLCLLSLQDWMAIDEQLRLPDQDAERINIPANPKHYWRYRMHMSIEQLQAATAFNNKITNLINNSQRR